MSSILMIYVDALIQCNRKEDFHKNTYLWEYLLINISRLKYLMRSSRKKNQYCIQYAHIFYDFNEIMI